MTPAERERQKRKQAMRLRGEVGLTEARGVDRRMAEPVAVHGGRAINPWAKRCTADDDPARAQFIDALVARLKQREVIL